MNSPNYLSRGRWLWLLMLLLLLCPWLVISADRNKDPDCSTQSNQCCGTADRDVDGPGPKYGCQVNGREPVKQLTI